MEDLRFYQNLNFNLITRNKYHYTDNRKGASHHYLAYMVRGRCRLVSRERTLTVGEGDLFFIPKGLCYQSYWESDDEIRFLSLGFRYFPESTDLEYLLQRIECPQELRLRVQQLPVSVRANSALLGMFYGLVSELLPYMEHRPPNPRQILAEKARDYLYRHTDCKVSDVARHCLVSESALYDVIGSVFGMTPNCLRQKILCEKAEQLLTTTDRSVQDISDLLGFSSPSYFRKVLRNHTGKTPREIRKYAGNL